MAEGNSAGGIFLAFWAGLLTVAVVAIIVSQKAQSSNVIKALASGIGTDIAAATAPVTGQSQSSSGG